MAQTQVVITAVDKTQAAMNSAVNGMKGLERTAKLTAKAMRFAFFGLGFLTGGAVAGFDALRNAAMKSEDGAKSINRLKDALNDPVLQDAASKVTKNLVDGFSAAVDLTAALVRNVSNLSKTNVLSNPEALAKLTAAFAGGTGGIAVGQLLGSAEAQARAIESQLSNRGPRRRGRGSVLGIQRTNIDLQNIAAKNAAEAQKKLAEEAKKTRQAMLESEAARAQENQAFKKEAEDTSYFLQTSFEAVDVTMATSVQNMLDNMMEADALFQTFAQQAASNIQSAFADFLFDPFSNGLKGMVKGFIDAIRRMIAELMASYLLRQFFQWMSGFGGITGTVGTMAVKALTGRAMGGPVSSGTPYMVGERGPELFVPGASGTIVPNHAMGGVTVSPVYNIDARGATADLQKALPGILNENNRRIFDELDRRYGIGR
jgi:hypothetical protein